AEMVNAIAARPGPLGWLWPLPLVVASVAVPLWLVDREALTKKRFWLVLAAVAGTLFLIALCGRFRRRPPARPVPLLLRPSTPPQLYRDLHDLAGLVTICAALVVLTPVRYRLRRVPMATLRLGVFAVLAASLTFTWMTDWLMPGWHARAWQHAHYQPRLVQL